MKEFGQLITLYSVAPESEDPINLVSLISLNDSSTDQHASHGSASDGLIACFKRLLQPPGGTQSELAEVASLTIKQPVLEFVGKLMKSTDSLMLNLFYFGNDTSELKHNVTLLNLLPNLKIAESFQHGGSHLKEDSTLKAGAENILKSKLISEQVESATKPMSRQHTNQSERQKPSVEDSFSNKPETQSELPPLQKMTSSPPSKDVSEVVKPASSPQPAPPAPKQASPPPPDSPKTSRPPPVTKTEPPAPLPTQPPQPLHSPTSSISLQKQPFSRSGTQTAPPPTAPKPKVHFDQTEAPLQKELHRELYEDDGWLYDKISLFKDMKADRKLAPVKKPPVHNKFNDLVGNAPGSCLDFWTHHLDFHNGHDVELARKLEEGYRREVPGMAKRVVQTECCKKLENFIQNGFVPTFFDKRGYPAAPSGASSAKAPSQVPADERGLTPPNARQPKKQDPGRTPKEAPKPASPAKGARQRTGNTAPPPPAEDHDSLNDVLDMMDR